MESKELPESFYSAGIASNNVPSSSYFPMSTFFPPPIGFVPPSFTMPAQPPLDGTFASPAFPYPCGPSQSDWWRHGHPLHPSISPHLPPPLLTWPLAPPSLYSFPWGVPPATPVALSQLGASRESDRQAPLVSNASPAENEDENSPLTDDEDEPYVPVPPPRAAEASPPPVERPRPPRTILKKRRKITDERLIKYPLEVGWRRLVRHRELPGNSNKMDVVYVAPCGKRLRTYPDISRYMDERNLTGLSLENFSFSAKVYVGEIYVCRLNTSGNFVQLTEEEVEIRKEGRAKNNLSPPSAVEKEVSIDEKQVKKRKLSIALGKRKGPPLAAADFNDAKRPCVDEIPGLKEISAVPVAFGDILMVCEFVATFRDFLEFKSGSLPSLKFLSCPASVVSVFGRMLKILLNENGPLLTQCNSFVESIEINENTISELLRIFLLHFGLSKYDSLLKTESFFALSVKVKAAIAAFLVSEVLVSKAFSVHIERHQERMGDLRREKWNAECQLRQLKRVLKEARSRIKAENEEVEDDEESENVAGDDESDEGDDDLPSNSAVQKVGLPRSREEIEKEISRLSALRVQCKGKLRKATKMMRSLSLGQDRYFRRYWLLPHFGGIFVEGVNTDEEQQQFTWNKRRGLGQSKFGKSSDTAISSSTNHASDSLHDRRAARLQKARLKRLKRDEEATLPSTDLNNHTPPFHLHKNNIISSLKDSVKNNRSLPSSSDQSASGSLSFGEAKVEDAKVSKKGWSHGWWLIDDVDQLKLVIKSLDKKCWREKDLLKNLTEENVGEACLKKKGYLAENCACLCSESDPVDSPEETEKECEQLLENIWELEKRLISANLQTKGWGPFSDSDLAGENYSRLEVASRRLVRIEQATERRYLKPPLREMRQLTQPILNASCQPKAFDELESELDGNKETVSEGLLLWRAAVSRATSPSQLFICLSHLKTAIAWEKSIMKVFCQVCCKGDKEDLLLLCDGCDEGVHTYCCKPKLSGIPESDWYCHKCVKNVAGDNRCAQCSGSSTTGKMIGCGQCPRKYHMRCLDPPISRIPKDDWCCPLCFQLIESSKSNSPTKPELKGRRKLKEEHSDMMGCMSILQELEMQPQSWPFLAAVNKKQVPSYYDIIENPMDFQTIRTKLKEKRYVNKEAFGEDVRLVFLNCHIFNEDDSEVGQAGVMLSQYFEKRWE
eukprot:m.38759 g.38759  ORF g.38759 m.38759 type:complete len:1182 (+) comp32635_c0_seq2:338-3883(+)